MSDYLYVVNYGINWKGYGDNKKEQTQITREQGLELISKWIEGVEKVFVLNGGAYSYTNIDSIEPIKTKFESRSSLTVEQANSSIKRLLENKANQLRKIN